MEKKYCLVFDDVILKQLRQAGKNKHVRAFIIKIFDKLEEKGPEVGKLLDAKLHIYEIKVKRPPLRLYFKHNLGSGEIYVFEYEMKSSKKKQQKTISRLRRKISES